MKGKKRKLSEVLQMFKDVHGDKYDYSLINDENYANMHNKVPIICRKHGIFYQTPHSHRYGYGCPSCGRKTQGCGMHKKARKPLFGIGINDYEMPTSQNGTRLKSYEIWKAILTRCYGKRHSENEVAYNDCSICEEWKLFSNFKKWFDQNYIEGYHLDKDILVKNNKVYSPQTCCFVPLEINTLMVRQSARRGSYPIGVTKGRRKNYRAIIRIHQEYVVLGYFNNVIDAFNAYKKAKEKHIKEIAQKNFDNGLITERVYRALMNYEVEITD